MDTPLKSISQSTKSEERGHSSSRKTETPLSHGKAKKQHRKKKKIKDKSNSSEPKSKTPDKKEIKGKK